MWFEKLIFTLCVLISSVEVNKSIDTNLFKDTLNCDYDLPWIITEYKYLSIAPFKENNTKCLQATADSCMISHSIDFSRGAVELNVYLQLFINESGLSVVVLNENNVPLKDYKLDRLNKDYTEGWNTILLDLEDGNVGYINVKARIGKGELIVIDSCQYAESISTKKRHDEINNKFPPIIENIISKNRLKRSVLVTTQPSNDFQSNGETNTGQSATIVTTESAAKKPAKDRSTETTETTNAEPEQQERITTNTEPLNKESEQGISTETTETLNKEPEREEIKANTESTNKEPEVNQTDDPDQVNKDSASSTDPQQQNFWTPITITLVAVGSFVVLSVIAVSAYYCGKHRARRDDVTNFITEDDIIPQPIIPRVKNVNRFHVDS